MMASIAPTPTPGWSSTPSSKPSLGSLIRQKSASVPDLKLLTEQTSLDAVQEDITTNEETKSSDDEGNNVNLVVTTPSKPPKTTSVWGSSAGSGVKKVPSFKDMLLLQVNEEEEEEAENGEEKEGDEQTPLKKRIYKPKFVVTPTIRRCSKSTGDLQSLCSQPLGDDDEEEIMGATDAMEYYHRKAKGYAGRKNGLKIRPDEAKRKDMSINKRQMQREAQQH